MVGYGVDSDAPRESSMFIVKRSDIRIVALANRHYSRTHNHKIVGSRCRLLVMRDFLGTIGFVWGWPYDGYRADGQNGANCEMFRNESDRRSSDLILESEAMLLRRWNVNRLFTYVDPGKIKSINPGYCFKVAGYQHIGNSKDGKHLLVKELRPENRLQS